MNHQLNPETGVDSGNPIEIFNKKGNINYKKLLLALQNKA